MPNPQPHLAVSRTRLGQLNDESYTFQLVQALETVIEPNSTVLIIGEQTLLPLLVSKMKLLKQGKGKVIYYELNEHFRTVLKAVAKHNKLENILEIRKDVDNYYEITSEVVQEDIDIIVAEPSFCISLLPWHNLFYWYMLKQLKQTCTKTIMPKKAIIWGCPVTFEHLWKIRHVTHVQLR